MIVQLRNEKGEVIFEGNEGYMEKIELSMKNIPINMTVVECPSTDNIIYWEYSECPEYYEDTDYGELNLTAWDIYLNHLRRNYEI